MAAYDSTQALALLGKTVSVVERSGAIINTATGVVTAVVVVAPGAPVSPSILVGADTRATYFDLDECELTIH